MTLAILPLTLSTSCSTTSSNAVVVPTFRPDVKKPTLETIPALDDESIPLEQRNAVTDVLGAYNRNMVKLIEYSLQLRTALDETVSYYEDAMKALY